MEIKTWSVCDVRRKQSIERIPMTTVSELRSTIFGLLRKNDCSANVLVALKNGNTLVEQEDYLWDYKEKIGISDLRSGSSEYKAKLCEITKDIVAFHNTFGGYLIFGVADKTGGILGCDETFPFDDISERIRSDLKERIDITSRSLEYEGIQLILVHVPRRSTDDIPKAFSRPAKPADSGKIAYKKDDIFYRDGIGSSPARGDALSNLISGKFEIPGLPTEHNVDELTQNNLPARNFDKRDFVGRHAYLDELWRWLLDPFVPIRLVTGIGGLGKTTLVRQFVESVLENSPRGLQSLIWFSAKSRHYDAELAQFTKTQEDDPNYFDSPIRLYKMLLGQLGFPENEIDLLTDEQEHLQQLINALCEFPSLVVIDDLDSLNGDQQAQVFQELGMVFSRTAALSTCASRCIFTARELVGAAPSQTIKLKGFDGTELYDHVEALYSRFRLNWTHKKKSNLFKKFLRDSGGSPLFAASIVRLVHSGLALDQALGSFQGQRGDVVRRFAFEREIDRLAPPQLRCLFAIINIAPCSKLELSQALEISEEQLLDEMALLRDFHLVERDDTLSVGGREYDVEGYIKLLSGLVEEKIADPRRIERRCKDIRKEKKVRTDDVAKIIGQVVSLWRADNHEGALSFTLAQKKLRSPEAFTPDLQCILGRAYLRVDPIKWQNAERSFRAAYGGGCQRSELFELWIEALEIGQDWNGAIEVSRIAIKETARAKYYNNLGRAILEQANFLVRGKDTQTAIEFLSNGGNELNSAFKRKHVSSDFSTEISSLRNQCYRYAIVLGESEYRANSEKLLLWELAWNAFFNYARTRNILAPGVDAALEWAEFKLKFSNGPKGGDAAKFDSMVGRLSEMLEVFYEREWSDEELVVKTENALKRVMQIRAKFVLT